MAFSRRQKLTIISLLFYWPVIFVTAHMPMPELVYKAQVSDKSLHFLAYLILTFLLWFSIRPDDKVKWRKALVWWVLLVIVGYGVVDELLQGYWGRNCDVRDFLADCGGAVAGLVLFTFFSYWQALLIVTAISIFLLENLARVNPADLLPVTNAVFHLFAYGFFAVLWTRYIALFLPLKAPGLRWLITALALPVGLLLVVKTFSIIFGRDFGRGDVIISAIGIGSVIAVVYVTALLRRENHAETSVK